MRNDVNVVVVAGVLAEDPKLTYSRSRPICDLRIVNTGWSSDGSIWKRSYLDLRARGRNAILCIDRLKKDKEIRVVGRLLQELGGQTVVDVEHVEFPMQEVELTPADLGSRAAMDDVARKTEEGP